MLHEQGVTNQHHGSLRVPPCRCLTSASALPQRAPGGSRQLGALRTAGAPVSERPAPPQALSKPPLQKPIAPRLACRHNQPSGITALLLTNEAGKDGSAGEPVLVTACNVKPVDTAAALASGSTTRPPMPQP